jgi:hypothetical protein
MDDVLKLTKDVVKGQARLTLVRKVTWSLQRSRSAQLVERLKNHEEELINLITAVNV